MSAAAPGPRPIQDVLKDILALPPDWHAAGSLTPSILQAIARHAEGKSIAHSLETGAGKSTLLFSHLSAHHLVFAMDDGNGSLRKAQSSPLLRKETVEFVEGPTQQTLPPFPLRHPLDLAMIDGPHAYPFPDLEYYFIYPHLAPGALFILDDTDIPNIRNMLAYLKADDMFELIETVRNTAFFRRTNAPTFNPLGDGWWLQGISRKKAGIENALGKVLHSMPAPVIRAVRRWLRR